MTVGGAIFVMAVGAILRYAVSDRIDGVDLQMVGLILMIAGAGAGVFALFMMTLRRERVVAPTGDRVIERPPREYY